MGMGMSITACHNAMQKFLQEQDEEKQEEFIAEILLKSRMRTYNVINLTQLKYNKEV